MKTKEELNTLKEEAETVNNKVGMLTDEELEMVNGGSGDTFFAPQSCPDLNENSITRSDPTDDLNKARQTTCPYCGQVICGGRTELVAHLVACANN